MSESQIITGAIAAFRRHDGNTPICCGLCGSPHIRPTSAGYARCGTITVAGIDTVVSAPIAEGVTGTITTYVCAGCRELITRTERVTGARMTRTYRRASR